MADFCQKHHNNKTPWSNKIKFVAFLKRDKIMNIQYVGCWYYNTVK